MTKGMTIVRSAKREAKTEANKWDQLGAGGATDKLTWEHCGAEDLKAALVAATGDGAALLLSVTSDKGALVIHVLTDRGTTKCYASDMATLNEHLSMIQEIAGS